MGCCKLQHESALSRELELVRKATAEYLPGPYCQQVTWNLLLKRSSSQPHFLSSQPIRSIINFKLSNRFPSSYLLCEPFPMIA